MTTQLQRLQLWTELLELQHRYVSALDTNRLEDWPGFFVEDCRYEIIPKENLDAGFPAPIVYCRNASMLRDRVLSLRHANIFEDHAYRHATSGLVITSVEDGMVRTQSSYIVVITGQAGDSSVYQAGTYLDEVVQHEGEWRYRSKRVVYDTLRVPTLLATPI
ncbi:MULTISPECIES: anthranilate 1,2-dioxygenase small subunit AndAd [unclassified Acidovorax]|uniref:anthranilate 1,2-dioxygenase small subunit AndAd n=1 Tax=unclassified Acidovorax TaxID=2684926 RepID=UPI001C48D63E|nr:MULTISPECIES: anthranilate 1,2-dioxygenase small subunit AndAd [unclassified Acidovorax]MBV7460416.1 aromatic-ring-hydroxylating dioxygenase subunit beta [Acidovorax sp. sif0632]MBV7465441.1 aromatic-ring-hydroxylating dioxygenase subunit beta [Acidovorax sp. sif0613]